LAEKEGVGGGSGFSFQGIRLAIPRAMNDSKHRNLIRGLVDRIDDDIWPFDEVARPLDQTGPADVR
jgi:hypothetical protein